MLCQRDSEALDEIEKIAEDFDGDSEFISGVVDFLIDIKWLRQDENGQYNITGSGKTYTINRRMTVPNFRTPVSMNK
ncbi:MAG: hypothetical protein ACRD8W_20450 [Nitrososphaeraceae archaeon]